MSEVVLFIQTNRVGSTVKGRTGYSKDEWDSLEEKDKQAIVLEIVWENIHVWEELE